MLQSFTADADSSRQCPIPCSRTLFEPSLSYASISRRNTEQVLFRDLSDSGTKTKQESVKASLRNTIETRQFTGEIGSYDEGNFKLLLDRLNDTISSVNEFYNVTKSPFDFAGALDVNDSLFKGLGVMKEELRKWEEAHYTLVWDRLYGIFMSLGRLVGLHVPFQLLDGIGTTLDAYWLPLNPTFSAYLKNYTTLESIQQCQENNVTVDTLYNDNLFDDRYYSNYTDPPLTNVTLCLYASQLKFRLFIQSYELGVSYLDIGDIDNTIKLYKQSVKLLLNDTGRQPQQFPEYEQCLMALSNIENATNLAKKLLELAYDLARNKHTYDVILERAHRIVKYMKQIMSQIYSTLW